MASGFVLMMNALTMVVLMVNDALLSMGVMHASVRMGAGCVTRMFAKLSVWMDASGLRTMGVISASVRKGVGTVANAIAKTRAVNPETCIV